MEIDNLTAFQCGALTRTARAAAPILLMALPRLLDRPSVRLTLEKEHDEIKRLVSLNLMEDVSDEFKDKVREHLYRTGRKFAVYGLTESGYHLFKESNNRQIN